MSSLKTIDIKKNLGKKGFEVNDKRDHIWFNYLTPEGKKTIIRTKISHGKDDIGDSLIGQMAKQVHLQKRDFVRLVTCTLSKDDYYKGVKNQL